MVVLCCSLGAATALAGPFAIQAFLPRRYAPSVDLIVVLAAGLYGGALHTTALFVVRGLAGNRLRAGVVAYIYALPLGVVGAGSVVAINLADVQVLALVRAATDVIGYTWVVAAVSKRAGIALPRIIWPLTGLGSLGVLAAFSYPDTLIAPLAIAAPALLAAAVLLFDLARTRQGS
jgi:hypothetical protein